VVTGIFGQEETVVKSLGPLLGKVPYIAGASIRGDGRVSLILDTGELISNHNRN
jgi:two-component system chemotaxis sensor kinase CheA